MLPGTSNPAHATVSAGGVGRNVAENLARLGVPVELLGAVGTDALSELVVSELETAGVGCANLVRSSENPVGLYAALLNEDGSLSVAASAMDATERLLPVYVERNSLRIRNADALVVDANVSPAVMEAALAVADGVTPVYLDPVSVRKARRAAGCRGTVLLATPNAEEAGVLMSGNAVLSVDWLVVTRGAHGCEIRRRGDPAIKLPARTVRPTDETGAGDALLAGIVAELVSSPGPVDSSRMQRAVEQGMRLAEAVVQSPHSVWKGEPYE
jgi:pseudouridine kinase